MKNLIFIFFCSLSIALFAGNNKPEKAKEAKVKEWLNNQPLEFIENKGQFTDTDGKLADNVLFKTSFGNCDIYITDKGLSYVFVKIEEGSPKSEDSREEREDLKLKFGEKEQEENKKVSYYRLDMDLIGANIDKANILKEAESKQGHFNYFYAHCPQGIYDVKAYGKITIKNIYKGIDWVIYTNSDSKEHPLKYDFVVHPGADYKAIQIKFLNAQSTTLTDNDTKLKIQTIAGNIEEGNLYSYQINKKDEIQSKYIIDKDSIISFEIANFDSTKTLVIDPLVWATFYGGTGVDGFLALCVDSKGSVYISGYGSDQTFPVTQLNGAYWQGTNATHCTYLLKFNNNGVRLWATFYGGNVYEIGHSLCVDSQDNVFMVGGTGSYIFPLQQLSGAYWQPTIGGGSDAFILKFNEHGIRLWATYYGGNNNDNAQSICIDSQDNLYVIGVTTSSNFPIQQLTGAYLQAINAGNNDLFILKFNNQGIREWATLYGGIENDYGSSIITDYQDYIYIIGFTSSVDFPTQQLQGAYWQTTNLGGLFYGDAFILKFNNQNVRLWATYYGGSGADCATSLCVDSKNNIIIVGNTNSTDFPTQQLSCAYWQASNAGLYDNFILKFNDQCVRQWATYYGGNNEDMSGQDLSSSISIDKKDNIYITGETKSDNIPTQQLKGEFYQSIFTQRGLATYISRFNKNCILDWATYFESNDGGSFGRNVVVDKQNNVFFTGEMKIYGFITVNPGNGAYYDSCFNGGDDSYILKFIPPENQKLSIQSDKNNLCLNDSNFITLTAIGGKGNSLKWFKNNCGLNYIGKNSPITINVPKQTTTYYARWDDNCDTSECEAITIFVSDCEVIIEIPNFFSPNYDNVNDVFHPSKIKGIQSMNTLIYNRWGNLVFTSDELMIKWDGKTNKGDKVADGVYYWIVNYTDRNNNTLSKNGSVTVMR